VYKSCLAESGNRMASYDIGHATIVENGDNMVHVHGAQSLSRPGTPYSQLGTYWSAVVVQVYKSLTSCVIAGHVKRHTIFLSAGNAEVAQMSFLGSI
jgi:hypothetical protein